MLLECVIFLWMATVKYIWTKRQKKSMCGIWSWWWLKLMNLFSSVQLKLSQEQYTFKICPTETYLERQITTLGRLIEIGGIWQWYNNASDKLDEEYLLDMYFSSLKFFQKQRHWFQVAGSLSYFKNTIILRSLTYYEDTF